MINRVVLIGRTTKEPVLRKTPNGVSTISFTVACARRAGQGQEQQTDFINCVAWGKTADIVNQYVRKGHLIGLEGRIQTRQYDDKDGKRVYVTEVICESVQLLEKKETNAHSFDTVNNETFKQSPDLLMDDVPF